MIYCGYTELIVCIDNILLYYLRLGPTYERAQVKVKVLCQLADDTTQTLVWMRLTIQEWFLLSSVKLPSLICHSFLKRKFICIQIGASKLVHQKW